MSADAGAAAGNTAVSWLHGPASTQAAVLAEVGWVLITGAAAIFVLVMALRVFALRPRARAVSGRLWLLGGGIAFPVLVLSALLVYNVWRTEGLERAPGDTARVISVTGHLWWWEVRYHDPASGRWITVANELHLPAGQPVRIGLQSSDVIHSFWVPVLGGKMDLVPGRVNHLTITANRPGVHRGACAEYCGTQHARMALHVVVEPPEEHARWLAAQADDAQPVANSSEHALLQRGRSAYVEHGCGACHSVRGVATGHALGPDLTHVGSRLYLGAGTVRNEPATLRRWIADVQALKPGARMPAFDHLDAATLDALTAYLTHLR